jgi:methyltransferase (TIGR00027 family)
MSGPESTAARVALWRAIHVLDDAAPPVLDDLVGLKLLAPADGWRERGDMHPGRTSLFRGGIVARARFIEDLVEAEAGQGVGQYVILGAGLDSFAQRRPELAATLTVFEVDQPGPQDWKRRRLVEEGYGTPGWLRFVPVDFEAGDSWWDKLIATGFDPAKPAVVTSTGVSMYLTRAAIMATLRQVAALAPGSTFAMTYILPMDVADPAERPGRQAAEHGARASGTPFITFFTPDEITALAREAGFRAARTVSAADYVERYFTGRTDGFRPGMSEEMLLATT